MYDECVEESSFELDESGDDSDVDEATDETFTSAREILREWNEKEESFVIVKSSVPFPLATVVVFMTIIAILIAAILATFCVLYHRVNAKSNYFVAEQGEKRFVVGSKLVIRF